MKFPLFFAGALSLAAALGGLPATAQIESPKVLKPALPIHPYVFAGVGQYKLLQGDYEAFGYALGAEYAFNRFFSADLGYLDFGTARTEELTAGLGGLLQIKANEGQEARRRAGYVLPTFRLRFFSRLNLSFGAGPGLVETRSRSYTILREIPKISAGVRHERHVEWLGKATLECQITPSWTATLAGYLVNSDGLTNTNWTKVRYGRIDTSFRTYAFLAGLRYTAPAKPRLKHEGEWTLEAGPVVSRLSYHANYVASPLGYNLAIRHRWRNGLTAELGRTDYGQSNETPRYPDGAQLRTPPYSTTDPRFRNDLQVEVGTTYGLLGAEVRWGERWVVGAAAGAAYTVGSFYGPRVVFPLRDARYNDVVTSLNLLGQIRAKVKVSANWHLSLGLRYHEFGGPQITHPIFEPAFGNTRVRIWTLLPQLSLRF